MPSILGLVLTAAAIGGLVYAGNKGYGYFDAVQRITLEFADVSRLVLQGFDLKFRLHLRVDNPSRQPINIDAIFLDIYLIESGSETLIGKIREDSINRSVNARSVTELNLDVKSNLLLAGTAIINNVKTFFSNEKPELKNIRLIGDITAEGVSIPIDMKLNESAEAQV